MRRVLAVIAKEPVPGQVKTRLCPPCDPEQAARVAACALLDTLDAVAATPAERRVLFFDGDGERWCPPEFELHPQRGSGLAARLGAAFEELGEVALLLGMDTPQVSPEHLTEGLELLAQPRIDAVFGPTLDGGYWSVGLKRPDPCVFRDVPMSRSDTYAAQRRRANELGLRVCEQCTLRDVDTIEDARTVALQAPETRFAEAVGAL